MKTCNYIVTTGNKEVAKMAFKTNEIFPIYPITPASEVSELIEKWASQGQKNMFGHTPEVIEMQSESGVAGTLHGALQTGALASTFTASQGLLLMIPNMFKMAGELLPHVIHCPTRSVATHALSVFGDHSDVMACRQTGYAMLAASSVQEVQDFALISQIATHATQIPFIHFYDGFRTSHEINTIFPVPDDTVQLLFQPGAIKNNIHDRRLTPFQPKIKGTSQGPDTFFQGREATNLHYESCASKVQNIMDDFEKWTGRSYQIFQYYGHPQAEQIIVCMGSAGETIEQTIQHLNQQGEKYGLIKVRLYHPFYKKAFLKRLPKSVKAIAVLDRTKEPGATGEPLLLDVSKSLMEAFQDQKISSIPKIIGGRYGLSSKEFTPDMVYSIFQNLKLENPKKDFTIGILDDLTHKSLPIEKIIDMTPSFLLEIPFIRKPKKTEDFNFEQLCQNIQTDSNKFVQGYTEITYKKSDQIEVSHLRVSENPIKAPYLIQQPRFIHLDSMDTLNHGNFHSQISENGIILLQYFNPHLKIDEHILQTLRDKNISIYQVNQEDLKNLIKELIYNNDYCDNTQATSMMQKISMDSFLLENRPDQFQNNFIQSILNQKGNQLPVSQFPVDGTFETNTSEFNKRFFRMEIPEWDATACTQCGLCSLACPQSAIRMKALTEHEIQDIPTNLPYATMEDEEWQEERYFSIVINPDQCTSCNHCIDFCESDALKLSKHTEDKRTLWNSFSKIPELDRTKINPYKVQQQQFQEPLYKYPYGPEGCGQAPYLKVLSQLFGDRMLIANATGASSIIGGALPTTPWSINKHGHGPAWSNSLFEDNAELGLGFALSTKHQFLKTKTELISFSDELSQTLIEKVLDNPQKTEMDFKNLKKNLEVIAKKLREINTVKSLKLISELDQLIKKSVWCIGGDGWAYDIGFGGIDHVLATQENINILVLDNEVYDNTGGQASKATPFGASAKFQHQAKPRIKKDLGQIAMTYKHAYVGSIALMANPEQALKTIIEAEQYQGPSLILAYCPSTSHGIDMKHPKKHIQAVVDSGHWPLYRYDPKMIFQNKNPFHLDTYKPSLPVKEFVEMEARFDQLKQSEFMEDFLDHIQIQYRTKYQELKLKETTF